MLVQYNLPANDKTVLNGAQTFSKESGAGFLISWGDFAPLILFVAVVVV